MVSNHLEISCSNPVRNNRAQKYGIYLKQTNTPPIIFQLFISYATRFYENVSLPLPANYQCIPVMNYTTYLFDFDYTLADSSRGIVKCFRNVLERNGYLQVTDEAIKRTIGKTLEDSFSLLTGVTDRDRLESFRQAYVKEADVHMTANTRFFPETRHVLRILKEKGAKLGIISTKYRYRIREMLDQEGIADLFDLIIGGEDVKQAKPSPEGLLLAMQRLAVSREEVLYIGDSTVDAETAQAAQIDFAGVTHGVTTAEELACYPHCLIIHSLEELY